MASLNKSIKIGRVGMPSEGNDKYRQFTIAVTETYKDKDHTEWFTIKCFNTKMFNFLDKFAQKGNVVYVEGRDQSNVNEETNVKYWFINLREFKILQVKDENQPKTSQSGDVPF